ncbi:hypothetical protein EZV62_008539 [Acer yangbiense]|uniref:Reverse transcriptase domain-containing protein n=1 Tax=Acer yangbiense TaxID=1000413 RepID=A0A5C7IDV8_9ROSI|nr:hypothetical protein EZV62_008539 [Acer yangbiense]
MLRCTKGEGHDFGFNTIGLPCPTSHNDDKVSLKKKCPNCGCKGVVKVLSWCGHQTLMDSGTPTKIANIEISEFEPDGEMSGPFTLLRGTPIEVMKAEAPTYLDTARLRGGRKGLSVAFTVDEVRAALFSMNLTKASGPDGFQAIFFQKFWGSIGEKVSRVCLQILNGDMSIREFNNTNVVLIP